MKTYEEAGYNKECWGDSNARELNAKAETLWDSTREAHSMSMYEYPILKALCNLSRYGRSLANMFKCPRYDQPTPVTKERVLLFIEAFADQYDLNLHTCKQIVDEALGKWKFLC
jgi:hypothetical protein